MVRYGRGFASLEQKLVSFVYYETGPGITGSFWFDNWMYLGLLINLDWCKRSGNLGSA